MAGAGKPGSGWPVAVSLARMKFVIRCATPLWASAVIEARSTPGAR